MSYKEYKNINYATIAEEIRNFWGKETIFEKSISLREGKPSFTFYEGPPSANGTPGIHHVMARTIKDLFCRYKTLKGFQVKRKGGWDTHGLPVELQVEKELGITKEDIGKKISIQAYNQKCRETVMRFTNEWNDLTQKMGYWVDLEKPYITYETPYIESCWWLLKELYQKNLLYKGYTIQPYSPAAGTGLSSHELNMPGTYHEVKDTSIIAQFQLKQNPKSEFLFQKTKNPIFALAWTTTPWTLPANTALTIGETIEYSLVQTFNPYTFLPITVLLAKKLLPKYFTEKGNSFDFAAYETSDRKILPWKELAIFKGKDLLNIEYEQLMPYVQPSKAAFRIISGDFVTTEDGTGIVHTAPTFGADDFRVAQQNNIPALMVLDEAQKEVPIVDKQGRFVSEITDFAHQYVKETYLSAEEKEIERKKQGKDKYLSVDEQIAIKLKTENKAFKVEKYEHSYPHCWRTNKPILYYPLDSWFIRTSSVKEQLIANNQKIHWKPESTGAGRFGNWLENLVDWNLSRSRYWGTPLPIWRTEDSLEEHCVGSISELKSLINNSLEIIQQNPSQFSAEIFEKIKNSEKYIASENVDLHRPFVDDIYFLSPDKKLMVRETDLIDVWFDSGAMPYAQWHYPFENQDIFKKSFPADFISEGVDQTRGWFFTLHTIATMISGESSFKNVVSTGLVLDKNGNKMSKSLGNTVDPFKTLATYGADTTRWYLISNAQPWDNLRFNEEGITEVRNKFFGTLTNTYHFFALYANLDNYKPSETTLENHFTELDCWILSKLQTLNQEVDAFYADYEPTKAARAIQDFTTENLSNWYVRLSRRRFWKGEMTEDKQAAYDVLHTCLVNIAQMMSPIAPFYADWLYKNLYSEKKEISVHLTDWQAPIPEKINKNLENAMELAQKIASMVHALRKKESLKVRQPLNRIILPSISEEKKQYIRQMTELICSEVNIKSVEFLEGDTSLAIKKKIKPNFKVLGPKFGAKLKAVSEAITQMDSGQIEKIEKNKSLLLPVLETEMLITLEDVEIQTEQMEGWLIATDENLTVALDTTLTENLINEGIAREFVNKIQNLRKDKNFEILDKIKISIEQKDGKYATAIAQFSEYICTEVQAVELCWENKKLETEIEIESESFGVEVIKIA